jgi:hypothetical protein
MKSSGRGASCAMEGGQGKPFSRVDPLGEWSTAGIGGEIE